MRRAAPRPGDQAGGRLRVGEDGVDKAQHLGRGAPAVLQRRLEEVAAGRLDLAAITVRLDGELLRLRALKGIDRLLAVADGEEGALGAPLTACAGEELTGQGVQNLPLV